jgi:fatty-acyl-CoA synthase
MSPINSSSTIPEALCEAAAEDAGAFRFHLDEGQLPVSFPELAERAARGARRLIARGVQPGDVIGILGPNRPEWLVWAHAAWMAGAAVAPVQIPLRIRRPDAFAEQLRALVRAAGSRLVLADPRLASLLPDGVGVPWEERGEQSGEEPVAPAPEDTAVIQFTSGSTAHPKGVVVPHAAVIAQLRLLYRHYYKEGVSQTTVGWVPFFHDLGLITTAIFPPFARSTVELLPTEHFARDPVEWLRVIERTRGLGTLAPSSAFGSAIRAAERSGERVDISSLIVAHFAAEGVDPKVAQRMAEVATRKFGLRPDALGSTYGLAEAVLGVSYSEMGAGMRIDRISLEGLSAGLAAPADGGPTRQMVSCGKPVMDLRIAASDMSELPERRVGEILVRGPSLASGYLGTATRSPFVDGWLRTGDLGYLADGELFVTGRAKDMVIAMGQNYYPEDFEWAAGRVPGVRVGRCVAFAAPGTERIVVLVEPSDPKADIAALRREVSRGVRDAVGVAASEVVVVPRDTVEKTTSGKLRRAAMRDSYSDGALAGAGGGR